MDTQVKVELHCGSFRPSLTPIVMFLCKGSIITFMQKAASVTSDLKFCCRQAPLASGNKQAAEFAKKKSRLEK